MNERLSKTPYSILKTLKIDMFGVVSLAIYNNQKVIVRDLKIKNKLYQIIARILNKNEVKILKKLHNINSQNFPKLIKSTKDYTIRSYISGTPVNQYPEKLNATYFNKALNLIETMHEEGIVHNDLEKSANWIVMDNGEPALIDFQLAKHFSKKTKLFKILKNTEIRHIIKSKKKFCNSPLSPDEFKILENRGSVHKFFRKFIKPLYNFITRKILNYSDRKSDRYYN